MKIAESEVIRKITWEILNLFKVEKNIFAKNPEHDLTNGKLTTKIFLKEKEIEISDEINPNEIERAEIHRVIKKNLYTIFIRELKKNTVPYGIMHGVRPTKIIHRWIRAGEKNITERLQKEYLVSEEKAKLMLEIATRQIDILKNSDEKTVSIYIGIPFCITRCKYCSFASNVLPNDKKISEFMTALTKDIKAAAEEIERYKFKVQNIYVGGGTPTSLPEKYFALLLEMIYNLFWHEKILEFTVECGRPDTITDEKILLMKKYFVSRVSVNPQTMQQRTLEKIGRRHTPKEIIKAYERIRELTNFEINMDLILGLPGEKLSDVIDSVEKVLKLNPNEITIHALALKRGSQMQMNISDEKEKIEEMELPKDEEVREMGKITEKMLREKNFLPYYMYRQGYISGQIENIGYSRDGAIGIYNVQIMDERQTIIGMGAAATTKVINFKKNCLQSTFNAKDLKTYIEETEKYTDKRRKLLKEIYGGGENDL